MLTARETAMLFISLYHDVYYFETNFYFGMLFSFPTCHFTGKSRQAYILKTALRTVNGPLGIFPQICVPDEAQKMLNLSIYENLVVMSWCYNKLCLNKLNPKKI